MGVFEVRGYVWQDSSLRWMAFVLISCRCLFLIFFSFFLSVGSVGQNVPKKKKRGESLKCIYPSVESKWLVCEKLSSFGKDGLMLETIRKSDVGNNKKAAKKGVIEPTPS